MLPKTKIALAFVVLTLAFGLIPWARGQESTVKTLETATFHGKVHQTPGRTIIRQESGGKLVLRLTNFKPSNGPM